MLRSKDDYSHCYGCCPCSLRVGVLLISLAIALQGVGYMGNAIVGLAEGQRGWVDYCNIVFGALWIALGVFAIVSVYKQKSGGISMLALVFKVSVILTIINDIILIIGMVTFTAAKNDDFAEADKVAFYVGFALIMVWHIACYINFHWVLGTIKSLKQVFEAGGKGDEKKNYLELTMA
ncbi:MAG: uncharacterized protein KVP18_003655 [Porospora cf. gigantea A]|uniref:uncharacterized protein n=1 Tax=Porospora cf. gigantea A TaxID=2853593 RepID=UPI00355A2D88|nr:MAG: hypothetical protein KVP18_003655 [Porospora cf. gigantea A]